MVPTRPCSCPLRPLQTQGLESTTRSREMPGGQAAPAPHKPLHIWSPVQPSLALPEPSLQPTAPSPGPRATPAPPYLNSDWTSPGFPAPLPGASSLPQRRRQPVTCPSSAARRAGLAWPQLWVGGVGGSTDREGRAEDNDVRQMKSAGNGGGARGEGRKGGVWLLERLGPSLGWGKWEQECGAIKRSSPSPALGGGRVEGVLLWPVSSLAEIRASGPMGLEQSCED